MSRLLNDITTHLLSSLLCLIHTACGGRTMLVMLCVGQHTNIQVSLLGLGAVGRVLNHSCLGRWRDREILFSAYLGIYCSAECNITKQKQDPNHSNSSPLTSPFLFWLFFPFSPSIQAPLHHYHNKKVICIAPILILIFD